MNYVELIAVLCWSLPRVLFLLCILSLASFPSALPWRMLKVNYWPVQLLLGSSNASSRRESANSSSLELFTKKKKNSSSLELGSHQNVMHLWAINPNYMHQLEFFPWLVNLFVIVYWSNWLGSMQIAWPFFFLLLSILLSIYHHTSGLSALASSSLITRTDMVKNIINGN